MRSIVAAVLGSIVVRLIQLVTSSGAVIQMNNISSIPIAQ